MQISLVVAHDGMSEEEVPGSASLFCAQQVSPVAKLLTTP